VQDSIVTVEFSNDCTTPPSPSEKQSEKCELRNIRVDPCILKIGFELIAPLQVKLIELTATDKQPALTEQDMNPDSDSEIIPRCFP
jgi:hypothetical protein